ncbi:SDR family NAD(P)-dependent oxidoreductase [Phytohabitans flavus]|uniref:SDR family NAD(P)-dependent oxidoreductase n=1 Tax=Phytohabitans flavus TaxID=1076124 RepID=UPI003632B5D6
MSLITTPFDAQSTASEVIDGVRLDGKRAVITGATSGIGLHTALALVRAGADVTLAVRDLTAGERAAALIRESAAGQTPTDGDLAGAAGQPGPPTLRTQRKTASSPAPLAQPGPPTLRTQRKTASSPAPLALPGAPTPQTRQARQRGSRPQPRREPAQPPAPRRQATSVTARPGSGAARAWRAAGRVRFGWRISTWATGRASTRSPGVGPGRSTSWSTTPASWRCPS